MPQPHAELGLFLTCLPFQPQVLQQGGAPSLCCYHIHPLPPFLPAAGREGEAPSSSQNTSLWFPGFPRKHEEGDKCHVEPGTLIKITNTGFPQLVMWGFGRWTKSPGQKLGHELDSTKQHSWAPQTEATRPENLNFKNPPRVIATKRHV